MLHRLHMSVRSKVMLLVVATTVLALALSAVGLVAYDLQAYERQSTNDLTLIAEILARASAPALSFDDRDTAEKDLGLIRVQPNVLAAALYTDEGRLFATYVKAGETTPDFPPTPSASGYRIEGDKLILTRRVTEGGEALGTIYIRAQYMPWARLQDYLAILALVMVASLALAVVLSGWLQRGFTAPLLDVARVARDVMNRRDYGLRARKTSDDEIGELVDAFNGMLAESGRRAEALREADRRKDEFLATLAHELRNPLAPLRNALDILRNPAAPDAMSVRAREMMQRQLQQMVRLVDDLLDVSRITTGKLAVRKTHVDVRDAVREAVETVQPFLESRHHALEVSIAPEPLEVDGDAARLSQVFGNLLHNAAKYTEPGGHLAISASHEDGNVVVRVKDDGIGLDPSALASIFEMFVQVDRSLTRAQAGLGVGLTLARRLVSLHGGTVTAYSGGLGHGTELIVRLPAADAVGTHAPGFPGHVPKRVLLADDNIEFAAGIAEAIENAGHEVRIAHDGAQALLEAQEFKPDIAFLDIGMPKVHGYEVARRLREDPSLRGITLVALTGWGHADDRDRARDAGFDRHLVKPVEAVDVLALVEESAPRPNVA